MMLSVKDPLFHWDIPGKVRGRIKKIGAPVMILFAGALYFWWLEHTGFGIPCLFRRITGFKCPGCGITHMLLHIIRFEPGAAFHDNPFLFLSLPFLMAETGFAYYLHRKGNKTPKWNTVMVFSYLILLIGFGIFRNIYGL